MTHVLQNVVFPIDRDPDLLPLYADPETWSVIDDAPVRVSNRAQLGNVLDRRRARIVAGRRVSFGTYFNAFAASYWQHWTDVRNVRLTVRTEGRATVLVYRSNGSGVRQRIDSREVDGTATSSFDVVLNQYSDGGWIWFDIAADDHAAVFEGAEWTTEQEPARAGKASIGITTYNKPDYCIATLQTLADAPEALELIDRIFVVDQGDRLVESEELYPEVAGSLGETLQILTQPNLGGSGGFARAMAETLERPESGFVQLLDDDVKIEPESLRRSIVFGRYATVPTLVGAHMFDLLDRPKLHAWAEVVDEKPFMWRVPQQEEWPHDFSVANLRQSKKLHSRMDSDYNGWWMCLIPLEVVREIGLPLPAFIKWDDAEYCLRAREHGFPTVSVPGVALWHVSWVGKDDAIDWQAYFHARNRIVAGLLHSDVPEGGTLLRHSRRADIKHFMLMQYYPVALRHRAIRDILSGPAHMRANLSTAMPAARALQKDFPETVVHKETGAPLRSRQGRLVFDPDVKLETIQPKGLELRWLTLRSLLRNLVRAPRADDGGEPEVEFAKADATWWRLDDYNSAIISAADGSGKNIYRRDRRKFRRMMLDSIRLHRRLRREWAELAQQYRAAQAELTSLDEWRATFEGTK